MYINGRFLTQRITGVQRFAYELMIELDKHPNLIEQLKIRIIIPKNFNEHEYPFHKIPFVKSKFLKGHLWEQLVLPFKSRGEILLNLCNTGALFKKNQLTVIHDAAVYVNKNTFSLTFRMWYKILFFMMAKFSKKIITVSQYSKKELINFLDIPNHKISVISEGKEQIIRIKSDRSILDRFNLNNDRYILAVSSLNPNKNFQAIIDATKDLPNDIKLVIAGGDNNKVFQQSLDLNKVNAIFVGYVTDEELKALYENAFCFVYPSFYEGFGLPPLEAMACGCPVIVSNTTSIPEVCGNAALYINPHNPKNIAEQVTFLLENSKIQEEFKMNGLLQSEGYSWKNSVEQLIQIIKEVSK
ncbi:glycosyltransferase family 4 protein [Neobacillus cucumis]|uniref:glycosyltransferase family 4 protein n=1 Tax=Neobacillus cucumis TaxID=1740721 RepID=UPI00196603E3|nr:glycosyltransferase family 1 protein [Neobacillus cucumis]MBM7652543.1 glycosyltransferase involved in cell wall biosynthesis [Neobacillus cucumis]